MHQQFNEVKKITSIIKRLQMEYDSKKIERAANTISATGEACITERCKFICS